MEIASPDIPSKNAPRPLPYTPLRSLARYIAIARSLLFLRPLIFTTFSLHPNSSHTDWIIVLKVTFGFNFLSWGISFSSFFVERNLSFTQFTKLVPLRINHIHFLYVAFIVSGGFLLISPKIWQYSLRSKPIRLLPFSCKHKITTPWILQWMCHHFCTNRVKMNITRKQDKIFNCI